MYLREIVMCGRYQLDDDMKAIIERYDIDSIFQDSEKKIGEIFPSNNTPVIVNEEGNKTLKVMKWGTRFSFLNHDIINARMESLFVKKLYNSGIISGRCLVPANYFYEWEKTDAGKVKRKIFLPDQKIISFAGMIKRSHDSKTGEKVDSFSIITRQASDEVLKIHDRMPAILQAGDETLWLGNALTQNYIIQILCRSQYKMKIA